MILFKNADGMRLLEAGFFKNVKGTPCEAPFAKKQSFLTTMCSYILLQYYINKCYYLFVKFKIYQILEKV